MSDSMRESMGDKAANTMKPDSQKSTLEMGQEKAQGAADSVAGTLQPEGEKSATQKAGDSVSGGSKDASKEGKSMMGSVQETLGNTAQSAQDALGMGNKK
ncbi:hypothetical protein LTR08_008143 [Meristemomyces frigidus]|nr:hypothetical protein LTR08_008143 [Meristemomyces frigidus]